MIWIKRFISFSLLLLILLTGPGPGHGEINSHSLFSPGERTEWMGTYLHGKKLGFSYAKMRVNPNSIDVNTKVFFRLHTQAGMQTTTFTQETHLTPRLELKKFSLLQEIMGQRQNVDGHVEKGRLVYRVRGDGFDKTKSIPVTQAMAPSSTFVLNIVRDGLTIGKKGRFPVFMEPFQMLVEVEYQILRKENFMYQGKPVETFVVLHRMAGMESTLWVTRDGSVMRELTNQGFESRREPETIARRMGEDSMSVSNLITLSLVKPGREIPEPGNIRSMIMRLSKIRSPDLIPQDQRQKILRSEKLEDGMYASVVQIHSEAKSVARPAIRPVKSFNSPEFLEETAEVQSRHPMIRALARDLVGDTQDAWVAAKRINQWVYSNLEKSLVDSVNALNALRERKGECQSHTYLFAALARAAGIPTKIVNGLVYSPSYKGFLYHAWPEVYVGEWRALDPTFGQDTVDATHIKLSEGVRDGPFKLMEFLGKVQIEIIEN